jgi:hypothetical protein
MNMFEGLLFCNLYLKKSSFNRSSITEDFDEKLLLLEEHDKLSSSLAALTRHFAHVQLRLQQVVSAPTPEDREVKSKQISSLIV